MSRQDPQLKLRLSPELKLQVEEASKASGRSMNAEIVHRLEQSFLSGYEVAKADPLRTLELPADYKTFAKQLAFELSDMLNGREFLGEKLSEYHMVEKAQPKPLAPVNRPAPKRRKTT